jgi:hypothetical protein
VSAALPCPAAALAIPSTFRTCCSRQSVATSASRNRRIARRTRSRSEAVKGRTYTWTLLQTKARVRLGGAPTFDQPGGRIVVPNEILRCPALQVSAPLDQAAILEDQLEPLLAGTGRAPSPRRPPRRSGRGGASADRGAGPSRTLRARLWHEGYRPGRIAKGLGRGDATCGTEPTCYGSSAVGSALPLRWS